MSLQQSFPSKYKLTPAMQPTPKAFASRRAGRVLGYWLSVICSQEETSVPPAVADLVDSFASRSLTFAPQVMQSMSRLPKSLHSR